MDDVKDKVDWAAQLREFLSEVRSVYEPPSAQQLLGDLEHLSEGVYMTSNGLIEVSRTVH